MLLLIQSLFLFGSIFSSIKADDCQYTSEESSQILQDVKAKIKPLVGKSYQVVDVNPTTQETYQYNIGICKNFESNYGVTQQKIENGQAGTSKGVGSTRGVHAMSGTDWVYLEYPNGEKYGSHCAHEARRAVIVITCDPKIDDSKAKMLFVSEENSKSEQCFYLFEMKHKAVCPAISSNSGLSLGSILVIVFIVVAGVYLFVGCLYSRFILGNKGMEQIPNYDFWQDFGNLVADGCDLVCRSGGPSARGYRPEGRLDDHLEQEEPVRDENLLPM